MQELQVCLRADVPCITYVIVFPVRSKDLIFSTRGNFLRTKLARNGRYLHTLFFFLSRMINLQSDKELYWERERERRTAVYKKIEKWFAVHYEEKANEVQLWRTMSASVFGRLQPWQCFRVQQRQTQRSGEVFEKKLWESDFRRFGEFSLRFRKIKDKS